MKKIIVVLLMVISASAFSQSRSVEDFRQDHEADLSLFFYKSTLQMYARLMAQFGEEDQEIPDLGKLVEGIDKIKFFSYNRPSDMAGLLKQLKDDIIDENYESVMSGKFEGNQMEVMMKEKRGNPVGFVVIVTNEEAANIMDIDGVPDLNNLMEFSKYVSNNTGSFNMLKNAFN